MKYPGQSAAWGRPARSTRAAAKPALCEHLAVPRGSGAGRPPPVQEVLETTGLVRSRRAERAFAASARHRQRP